MKNVIGKFLNRLLNFNIKNYEAEFGNNGVLKNIETISNLLESIFNTEAKSFFTHRRFIMRKENMFGACAFVVISSMFYVVGLVL